LIIYCPNLTFSKEEFSNSQNENKIKVWSLRDVDADHVTAWSKGGAADISSCEMLYKTHNRAKGWR